MKQFACHMNLFFIQNIILTRWSKEHLFVLFILTVFCSNYWRNFEEKCFINHNYQSHHFFLPKKVQIKLFNSINRGPFLKRWIAKKSYSFRRVTPLVIPLLSIQTSRRFTFFWEGISVSFQLGIRNVVFHLILAFKFNIHNLSNAKNSFDDDNSLFF